VGGAIIYANEALQERGKFLVNALGVSQSPYDAWLVLRGVKTLAVRMEAHQANGLAVAKFLDSHPNVKKVYYPGLPSHPGQDLIKKQMTGFGGMLSFELDTVKVDLDGFFSRLKLFCLAESLGGIESLIEHPWLMSHSSMGEAGLQKSGISKETIRVSLGIEGAQDLIDSLDEALKG
ncbi:MAG: PLP-dependent aspartate aminotransferase family protein, partial [Candidatus Omnitrophica bacterium]|nr:PLP-dependent aspartate aminotransferase family protein [Candidatus Omnitrophota bacterium]